MFHKPIPTRELMEKRYTKGPFWSTKRLFSEKNQGFEREKI
jgi:hypothetical protein